MRKTRLGDEARRRAQDTLRLGVTNLRHVPIVYSKFMPATRSAQALFAPFTLKGLTLPNRIVMAPMTRSFSPGGIPTAEVAAYYRRRAEGGTGLIITEGTYLPHPLTGFDPKVPRLAEAALPAWSNVVEQVHAAGARIFSQLWHVGMQVTGGPPPPEGQQPQGPSMTQSEIDQVIAAYGTAAANAQAAGFDGVEIHGAHGYLLDQFFWERTNTRTDAYGGSLANRSRLATEVVAEIRSRVGPAYPIGFRFSQWKIIDYAVKLAATPAELAAFLEPLTAAGVDIFHASTRRFWDPEFEGSNLTLAAWTRKLTGRPVIAVGSVTFGADVMNTFCSDDAAPVTGIDEVLDGLEREEFDLIAIGRALLANPDWPRLVRSGALDRLVPFTRTSLTTLL